MLLNRFADIPLCLFYSPSVTEAAGQGRAVGKIAVILFFLFNNYFEAVELHRHLLVALSMDALLGATY